MSDFLSRLWTSPLSTAARLVGAYLATGPHANHTATPRVPPGYAALDLGIDEELYLEAVAELCRNALLTYCPNTHTFFLAGALARAPNPNVATGRVRVWRELAQDSVIKTAMAAELLDKDAPKLKPALIDELRNCPTPQTVPEPFPNRCETVPKPLSNHSRTVVKPFRNGSETVDQRLTNGCDDDNQLNLKDFDVANEPLTNGRASKGEDGDNGRGAGRGVGAPTPLLFSSGESKDKRSYQEEGNCSWSEGLKRDQLHFKNQPKSCQAVFKETGKKEQKERKKSVGSRVWEKYAQAYLDRYGILPVRNAKTNAQCAALVTRLGAEDSPLVARWYVNQGGWYAKRAHPLDLLIKDAETLRMRWATNRNVDPRGDRTSDDIADILNANGVKTGQFSPENEQTLAAVFAEDMDREISSDNENTTWLLQ